MSEPGSGQIVSSHLLKLVLGVVSLIALAMLACSGSDGGSESTPTAPPGMFSTLPTSEPPVLGDQPPTVELNTPEPTLTPQPTPTPNPTYTPVPTPTPLPTGTPTPNPTGTPAPTATSNPTGTPVPTATANPTGTPVPIPTATANPTAMQTPEPLPRGSDVLLKAIQDRNVTSVKDLVEAGLPVNVQDEDGNPFLDVAINKGRVAFFSSDIEDSKDIVQILVDAGADVSARNADGNPVLYSSFRWSSDIVQILVDAGADVNATIAGGNTLLYEAVRLAGAAFFSSDIERYDRIVQILVAAGAKP